MTKIQYILREIKNLNVRDLQTIMEAISIRINRSRKVQTALEEIKGTGAGVWTNDAQISVSEMRTDDRV